MKVQRTEAEQAAIREAMRIIGSSRSEAKRKAAAENSRKPRPGAHKPRKSLEEIECTCSGSGLDHRTYCKRGRAIKYRKEHNLPLT